jgi:hypothetical protein
MGKSFGGDNPLTPFATSTRVSRRNRSNDLVYLQRLSEEADSPPSGGIGNVKGFNFAHLIHFSHPAFSYTKDYFIIWDAGVPGAGLFKSGQIQAVRQSMV